ncbi:hypothetical protein BLJAPNOD_05610 [Ensifer sp. M14]|jgi:hypothetical protein|nr:hypothetical protein BLJAPNOD_05610 [Ensifer sp. M14]
MRRRLFSVRLVPVWLELDKHGFEFDFADAPCRFFGTNPSKDPLALFLEFVRKAGGFYLVDINDTWNEVAVIHHLQICVAAKSFPPDYSPDAGFL